MVVDPDVPNVDPVVADPDVPNVDPVVKRDATARVAVLTNVNLVHAADQRDALGLRVERDQEAIAVDPKTESKSFFF